MIFEDFIFSRNTYILEKYQTEYKYNFCYREIVKHLWYRCGTVCSTLLYHFYIYSIKLSKNRLGIVYPFYSPNFS